MQPLFEKLLREKGIALITGLKKNMHTIQPMLAEADRPDRRAGPIGAVLLKTRPAPRGEQAR